MLRSKSQKTSSEDWYQEGIDALKQTKKQKPKLIIGNLYERAFKAFAKAASGGHVNAMYALAKFYRKPAVNHITLIRYWSRFDKRFDVFKPMSEGARMSYVSERHQHWLNKAAEHDHGTACLELGNQLIDRYEHGEAVSIARDTKDLERAVELLNRAVVNGEPYADLTLVDSLSNMLSQKQIDEAKYEKVIDDSLRRLACVTDKELLKGVADLYQERDVTLMECYWLLKAATNGCEDAKGVLDRYISDDTLIKLQTDDKTPDLLTSDSDFMGLLREPAETLKRVFGSSVPRCVS